LQLIIPQDSQLFLHLIILVNQVLVLLEFNLISGNICVNINIRLLGILNIPFLVIIDIFYCRVISIWVSLVFKDSFTEILGYLKEVLLVEMNFRSEFLLFGFHVFFSCFVFCHLLFEMLSFFKGLLWLLKHHHCLFRVFAYQPILCKYLNCLKFRLWWLFCLFLLARVFIIRW